MEEEVIRKEAEAKLRVELKEAWDNYVPGESPSLTAEELEDAPVNALSVKPKSGSSKVAP